MCPLLWSLPAYAFSTSKTDEQEAARVKREDVKMTKAHWMYIVCAKCVQHVMSDIALTARDAPQPEEYNNREERHRTKKKCIPSHFRTLIIIRLATYPSWVEYVTENSSAVLETFGASDLAVGIQNKHARVFDICICQPWGFTSTCGRRGRRFLCVECSVAAQYLC